MKRFSCKVCGVGDGHLFKWFSRVPDFSELLALAVVKIHQNVT